ncbi:MAG: type II toxin-antitoxin system VapC family toxin [Alphaproteobacteria bacterium]|nr:type II toxin-antitoxin system VapC family toxin [Alphaproteobacteria bacterium]
MAIFVDSNVLLDVLTEPSEWAKWSAATLAAAANRAPLVINAIVYAEISVHFPTIEALEAALPRNLLRREPISENAAFLAGKAFLAYRRRGGTRTAPLPDFLIGAHAATAGHTLLTRDSNRYRTYFPRLPLIAPS